MASAEDELRQELEEAEPEQNRQHDATRIVEPDEGATSDDEKDMIGEAVADDDINVSAEEAAIHIEEAP